MLRRIAPIFLLGLTVIVLSSSSFTKLTAQDTKKFTGRLPNNWGKLGLSVQQKQAIYKIQTEYAAKLEALQQQISKLEKDEKIAMVNVLTEQQLAALRKIYLDKTGANVDPFGEKVDPKNDDKSNP